MIYAFQTKLGSRNSTLHQHQKWNFQYANNCIFEYSTNESIHPPIHWQLQSTINTATLFRLGNFEQANICPGKNIPVFQIFFLINSKSNNQQVHHH